MSSVVKDHNPVLKEVLGLNKALKIDANSLNLGVVNNLYLSLDLDGDEKLIPFQYNKEQNDYRIHRIPMQIPDEIILEGKVVQVDVSSENEINMKH